VRRSGRPSRSRLTSVCNSGGCAASRQRAAIRDVRTGPGTSARFVRLRPDLKATDFKATEFKATDLAPPSPSRGDRRRRTGRSLVGIDRRGISRPIDRRPRRSWSSLRARITIRGPAGAGASRLVTTSPSRRSACRRFRRCLAARSPDNIPTNRLRRAGFGCMAAAARDDQRGVVACLGEGPGGTAHLGGASDRHSRQRAPAAVVNWPPEASSKDTTTGLPGSGAPSPR